MKLIARRRILHDGRVYGPGDRLDVYDGAAEALVAAGAADPVRDEPARPRRRRDR